MVMACVKQRCLIIPDAVVKGNKEMHVQVFNPTDIFVNLKANYEFGVASEILSVKEQKEFSVRSLEKVPNYESEQPELPAHIDDLFQRLNVHLSSEQKGLLKMLLLWFQDIFSKGDSDIGCFSEITHKIDTNVARPIRQPMRT
jgi:hypothetical protein